MINFEKKINSKLIEIIQLNFKKKIKYKIEILRKKSKL